MGYKNGEECLAAMVRGGGGADFGVLYVRRRRSCWPRVDESGYLVVDGRR